MCISFVTTAGIYGRVQCASFRKKSILIKRNLNRIILPKLCSTVSRVQIKLLIKKWYMTSLTNLLWDVVTLKAGCTFGRGMGYFFTQIRYSEYWSVYRWHNESHLSIWVNKLSLSPPHQRRGTSLCVSNLKVYLSMIPLMSRQPWFII